MANREAVRWWWRFARDERAQSEACADSQRSGSAGQQQLSSSRFLRSQRDKNVGDDRKFCELCYLAGGTAGHILHQHRAASYAWSKGSAEDKTTVPLVHVRMFGQACSRALVTASVVFRSPLIQQSP